MSVFHPHLYKKCNKDYSSLNTSMPRIQSYAVLLTSPWNGFVWAKVNMPKNKRISTVIITLEFQHGKSLIFFVE